MVDKFSFKKIKTMKKYCIYSSIIYLLTFVTGNCKHTSWPRPCHDHSFPQSLYHMHIHNIRLKIKS